MESSMLEKCLNLLKINQHSLPTIILSVLTEPSIFPQTQPELIDVNMNLFIKTYWNEVKATVF